MWDSAIFEYLSPDYDGAFLQEESEVACEIEAPRKPFPFRNIQLRAALVGERAEIEDGVLERDRVQGHAVAHRAKLSDRHAVRPRI